ncbi:hypothetical protein [Salinicola aestuarinus]|uniref:hypothetical protein n=1 Tax=Salinicola aestuarinus TaxID=1949082 RepID=UPI000DA1C6FB|nr:hypothetical protein [Salinicola aestuarinus]
MASETVVTLTMTAQGMFNHESLEELARKRIGFVEAGSIMLYDLDDNLFVLSPVGNDFDDSVARNDFIVRTILENSPKAFSRRLSIVTAVDIDSKPSLKLSTSQYGEYIQQTLTDLDTQNVAYVSDGEIYIHETDRDNTCIGEVRMKRNSDTLIDAEDVVGRVLKFMQLKRSKNYVVEKVVYKKDKKKKEGK